MTPPELFLVDFVARDMEATIAFYRALGLDIPETAIWRTATGIHHVDVTMPGGATVHFDSPALAKVYDRGWREPSGTGTRVVLSFRVDSRAEVDLNMVGTRSGRVIEVQGTAEGAPVPKKDVLEMMDIALTGIHTLTDIQTRALAGAGIELGSLLQGSPRIRGDEKAGS